MMSGQTADGRRETMHPDLFNDESTPIIAKPNSWAQQRKKQLGFRPCQDKSERCKVCAHCYRQAGTSGTYYKCELIGMTRSQSTDVKANYVCNQFELKAENNE